MRRARLEGQDKLRKVAKNCELLFVECTKQFLPSRQNIFKDIPRHQPRVAVRRVAILETLRVERVVTVGHGMLNVVATGQSLDA